MTSKTLLRIASIYMFIRLAAQLYFPFFYEIPESAATLKYIWQPGNPLLKGFFYWAFSIAFALLGRLLWVVSDSKEIISGAVVEGAFWFLFSFGIEEFIYRFYYTGTATIICSFLVGISYFKSKGLSIKITFNKKSE